MAQSQYAQESEGSTRPALGDVEGILPIFLSASLSAKTVVVKTRSGATMDSGAQGSEPKAPNILELLKISKMVCSPISTINVTSYRLAVTAEVFWGARCGKSARRVLIGGTSARKKYDIYF